jgi:hypothetical protein
MPAEAAIMDKVFARLPDLERDAVLVFIHTRLPEEERRFRSLALRSEPEATQVLLELVKEADALLKMEADDPGRFVKVMEQKRLERRARELAALSRRQTGGAREKSMAELKATLDEGFRVKQELMRMDLEQMYTELRHLKTLLDKREEHRSAIISRRLAELTGDLAALDW